jgi:hypothetical protein
VVKNFRAYSVKCQSCFREVEGDPAFCNSWLKDKCESRTTFSHTNHIGLVLPVFLPGVYKCTSCKQSYGRIKGGTGTEELCEQCVDAGKSPGQIKMSTSRELNCGVEISYSPRDLYGKNYSHVRKDFIFGGENWACSSTKSTYDTLSGSGSYPCGKKANMHIKFPKGFGFSNGGSTSECAVFCKGCAGKALELSGATSLGF